MQREAMMILSFLIISGVMAANSEAIRFNQNQTRFIENKGQVVNQYGQPNRDVWYLLNSNGLNVQLKSDGFSYEVYKFSKKSGKASHAIQNGKRNNTKGNLERVETEFAFHRIDIRLIGMNRDIEIAVDPAGNAYITGFTYSTGGIATPGAYQTTIGGANDVFLSKFSVNGQLLWGTYYGGPDWDGGYGLLRDTDGNLYITGYTWSVAGIATPGAYQAVNAGNGDAFLAKFESATGMRTYSTYFGGSDYDNGYGVSSDGAGNSYITGLTSSGDGIATPGAYQTNLTGGENVYLAKFNASGTRQWGTYYGGTEYDEGYAISTDLTGNSYITGWTSSPTGIATPDAFKTTIGGTDDAFLAKFSSAGAREWGTYFGGDDFDYGNKVFANSTGNIFLAGYTDSFSGIATVGAHQTIPGGSGDGFLAKFSVCVPPGITSHPVPVQKCSGETADFQISATGDGLMYQWQVDMGAGFSDLINGGSYSGVLTNHLTVSGTNVTMNGFAYRCVVSGNCLPVATSNSAMLSINPLPIPGITGPASICTGTTGNAYLTESGMTGYTWTISPGGAITAGAGTNAITVSWNTPGAQTVSVNYINGNGCTAVAPTQYDVTVNPLPVPTITGPVSLCMNASGVFITETGMTGYVWTVTPAVPPANITGQGTPTVSIVFPTVANYSVSVNYINGSGCTASSPTIKNVSVNPLPLPTISGPSAVCATTSGNVYTTQSGMTGYSWSVSSGGTIASGSGTNSITVTWNNPGAQNVYLNYVNATGCTAVTPSAYPVTVNARPVPTISGPTAVCAATAGNIYTTQAGMTGYIWTISSGGTITSGVGTSSITVTWNTAGSQSVTVNYNNASGCNATNATVYNVNVNNLPSPTITGSNDLCVNSGYYNYTTEPGMSGYTWTVSSGGTITYGSGTNQIQVVWNTAGSQNVSVTYANSAGCSPSSPSLLPVNVNPMPGAAGVIAGTASVCAGSMGVAYSVAPILDAISYVWYLPPGATIATGFNTNTITVNFAENASSGTITVQGNNLCGNGLPSPPYAVSITPLPDPAETITGQPEVCQNTTGVVYSVELIANATSYTWTIPSGAIIVNGGTTNAITVDFGLGASSGNITVAGINSCGFGTVSPPFVVTVIPKPSTPLVSSSGDTVFSNVETGNQWYYSDNQFGVGELIQGATGTSYIATQTGWYWSIVTNNGCSSDPSNREYILMVGQEELIAESFIVYPVPNDGKFTVSVSTPVQQKFSILVYNKLGQMVYEIRDVMIAGEYRQVIDLRPAPSGVYIVNMVGEKSRIIRKILIH